jgi:glutamate--cysteine ligase
MQEKHLKECSKLRECQECTELELKSKVDIETIESTYPLDEPIGSVGDLVQWFHNYCIPERELRVGIEVERLGVYGESGKAITYTGDRGLEPILRGFEESRDWTAVGSPVENLHEVWEEQEKVTRTIKGMSRDREITWIGIGMHPFSSLDEIEWVPKGRYKILSKYLEKAGRLGHYMMKQTASIQVSFDYLSEEDALRKMRLATVLSPVTTAMFANSPISDGELNGYLSRRARIWSKTDPSRCGMILQLIGDDIGFSDYVDYALSVPMLFIVREGEWIKMEAIPFRRYLEHGSGGYRATFGDWDLHLTTLFPEVRMKRIVEVRSADCQRPGMMMTVPAFWKGLLYDPQSMDDAWNRIGDIPREVLTRLMEDVPRRALETNVDGYGVRDLAEDMVRLSRNGLVRQGKGEEILLEPLEEFILQRGITPAEDIVQRWESGWKDNPIELIEFHKF